MRLPFFCSAVPWNVLCDHLAKSAKAAAVVDGFELGHVLGTDDLRMKQEVACVDIVPIMKTFSKPDKNTVKPIKNLVQPSKA